MLKPAPDKLEITSYISINLLLFGSWYIFLYGTKDVLLFADRWIGTFLAGLTQIIATEMLLGVVFKQLYPMPLFILNVLISICVLGYAMLTFGSVGVFSEMRDAVGRIFRIITGDKILLCIFSLFFISVCRILFVGFLFPSYSWDALYYHLPMVGQIMQSGAIQEHTIPSLIQPFINIFSKNINLFFVWNIIFLKSDVIVDLSQLVFILFGVLSVYSMAVKLKINEKYAVYAALLFFFTPVLMFQAGINYVDGAVSTLFLMAVNFLMYDDPERNPRPVSVGKAPVVFSGLATGILLGSKATGPVFIPVIVTAVIIREIIKHAGASGEKGYSLSDGLKRYLVYFLGPIFFTGGYWYMRNWILHGNPVYYMDVSIFNVMIFKGLKSDWVEPNPHIIDQLNYLTRLVHVWLERVGYYMYDSRFSGFGAIWFILFLPGIFFSLVYAAIKKKYNYLFISAVLIVTFLIHPRNWTTRYVIFIVGLGALSFGFVLDYFNKRETPLKILSLLLVIYAFLTINSPCIMPEQVKEFFQLPAEERTLSRHKPFNIDIRVRKEYGYWIWMDKNISRGDTLAYTFEVFDLAIDEPFFTTPLWNREFSNKVAYVKSETYKEWLKELNNNNATFILIKTNSIEDKWIKKERKIFYLLGGMRGNAVEKFSIVYSDDKYKIIKYMGAEKEKGEG